MALRGSRNFLSKNRPKRFSSINCKALVSCLSCKGLTSTSLAMKKLLRKLTGMIHSVNYDKDHLVTPNFIHYEYVNGHNYLMNNGLKRISLLKLYSKYNKLSAIMRLGIGGLVPKTDSYILENHNDGTFKLSGIVIGAWASLRYDLLNYFFLETGALVDYTKCQAV